MTTVVQDALLSELIAALDAIDSETRVLRDTLGSDELARTAADGGWTIGQVFEHLIVANSLYYDAMEKALARSEAAGSGEWRPTFFGKLLFDSLSPRATRKLRSPRVFRPGPAPRVNVVQSFLDSQERFRALARNASGRDLGRTRVPSPVNRLIRVNLGDAFRIIVVHEQRHFQQIRRILER